jgi:acyl-CoA synthetase (AMP-forming)/AMP-acid ligase II
LKKRQSEIQVFSIAFLDVLSCALGALILVLVIVPISPPTPEAQMTLIQQLKVRLTSIVKINEQLEEQNEELKKQNSEQARQINAMEQKSIPEPSPEPKPSLFGIPLVGEKAIFVIDVSGSMSWQEHNLYNTIRSLLFSCDVKHFRFIFFDTYIYSEGTYWKHKWLEGTQANKEKIIAELKGSINSLINSEPFLTNSWGALEKALQYKDCDVIYFITDGYPTAGETNVKNILQLSKHNNKHKAIINSIMVGLPGTVVNQYGAVMFSADAKPKELYDFLHDLAEQNGGVYVGR